MFDFCPTCGQTIEQEEFAGQMLICIHCGKPIGLVSEHAPVTSDAEPVNAARCPVCRQIVQRKLAGKTRTLAPHYGAGGKPKICPGSGKKSELEA